MAKKFFFKEPDTKEQVEAKIENLSKEIGRLLISIEKMQKDLRDNHLSYGTTLVRMKEQGLKEAQQSVSRKKRSVETLKIKLTKFKTVHLD